MTLLDTIRNEVDQARASFWDTVVDRVCDSRSEFLREMTAGYPVELRQNMSRQALFNERHYSNLTAPIDVIDSLLSRYEADVRKIAEAA